MNTDCLVTLLILKCLLSVAPKKLHVTVVVPKPQEAILAHKKHSAGSFICPCGTNFSTSFQVEWKYHIANKLSPANPGAVVKIARENVEIFCMFELINL